MKHLRLLLPHTVDAGGQLHRGQRLHVARREVGDVSDHGGAAVDVAQGFAEQHGELAVPE